MAHAIVQTDLVASDANLQATLKRGEASIVKFGRVARAVISGFIALWAGRQLIRGIGVMIQGTSEAATAQTKLRAVLKTTGNVTGFTTDQLIELARQLRDTTGVIDDLIVNAEAVLASFLNIRGDVFKDAIKAAIDLSRVFDQDLKSSTIQIGKALQDPILGLTALRRIGVSFSIQQREMIQNFIDQGDIVSAQRVILDEFKVEVGGVADAMGKTFGSQATILKEKLLELVDTVGEGLVPIMTKFISFLNSSTGMWERVGAVVGIVTTKFINMAKKIAKFFWPIIRDTFIGITAAVIASMAVFKRWKDAVDIVWKTAALGVIVWWKDLAHILGVNLPELLDFVSRNWFNMLKDLTNMQITVSNNIAKNFKDLFTQISKWMKGEGFDFEFTGLTEGFKSSMTEVLKLTKRIPEGLELELAKELNALGLKESFADTFMNAFKDARKTMHKFLNLPSVKPDEIVPVLPDDPFSIPAKGDKKGKTKKSFEDLASLYKRIAIASATKSPEEKQVDELEKGNQLAEKQLTVMDRIAINTKNNGRAVAVFS